MNVKNRRPIDSFLSELNELEVELWAEGDRLRYKAPRDTLSPSLLDEIRERKTEILGFLHQTAPGDSQTAPTSYPYDVGVEKVNRLTYRNFVDQYLNSLRPVVITDAVQNWQALSRWTPEFLQETLGSKKVVIDSRTYQFGDFLDEVISSTEENPVPYLRDADIPGLFPELLPDIQPSIPYIQSNWLASPLLHIPKADPVKQRNAFLELLVAGKGTKFPILHFDYWHLHAIITQIYGVKEFTLYPPDQTKHLYPCFESSNKSLISDIQNPDLEQFPLFAKATAIKIVVEPGETIFVPSGWWHTTRMLSPSIAVTVNCLSHSNWKSFSQDVMPDWVELALAANKQPERSLNELKTSISNYLGSLGQLLSSFE